MYHTADKQDKRREAQRIKCQASDMLSLMGVLAVFTHQVLLNGYGTCTDACNAFLALADVVEPSSLDNLVEKVFGAFCACLWL